VETAVQPRVDRVVAPAALGRAVLLGRAAATMTATAAGLGLVDNPRPLVVVLVIVLSTTMAGCAILARWPRVVRWPVRIVVLDSLVVLAVLAVSQGGVAYFCCAVGASALAGVLLGMRAIVLWAAHAALGYLIAATVLHSTSPPAAVAAFVVAFPMAGVLAGIGAAVAKAALVRYVDLSVEVVASAQRSAAASERARLARELHDSVAKTLRGVSFAALALPTSLRRHPALAEQLASTVSKGATAAAREARELLEGLRLDTPDRALADTVHQICRRWTQSSGIPVQVTVVTVDPPVAVRYELTRILHEALRNIDQHARAQHVQVCVTPERAGVQMSVRDDGVGFHPPDDLSRLRGLGHFGVVGMYERAHSVHGTVKLKSAPGLGTTLEVWMPIADVELAYGTLSPIASR
jgi:signal transduction histidine kinase